KLVRPSAAPSPLGAIIRVYGANATPQCFRLSGGKCVVGSAPSCDLVIAEPTVSRNHVELPLVPGGGAGDDLGVSNGTFFLGQRVERMTLAFGGRIAVGAATLVIEADTEALSDGLQYSSGTYRGIVGISPAMRRLFALLTRLEGSLVTVLVEGESGVG